MPSHSRSVTIAEAYAGWLNDPDRAFGGPAFRAAAAWDVAADYEDIGTEPLVQIQPIRMPRLAKAARGLRLTDYTMLLGFRQRLPQEQIGNLSDWIDERVKLIEDIASNTAEISTLPDQPTGYLVFANPDDGVIVEAIADELDLTTRRQLTAIIEVTFRELRST